jgi:hypothetical protein
MGKASSLAGALLNRWRVARYRRGQLNQKRDDRRREEHQERRRHGIRDNLPPT